MYNPILGGFQIPTPTYTLKYSGENFFNHYVISLRSKRKSYIRRK